MKIIKKEFGKIKSEITVYEYELLNTSGVSVKILNYGGIIREILIPDRHGKLENIVLGFDNLESYEKVSPYFGCIIGRTAGRISGGKFSIDGEEYTLPQNDGRNSLHGGINGFNELIWDAEEVITKEASKIILTCLSPDGDEGYPGNLKVSVSYTLTENNEFIIDYEAVCDKKTPINLTNHSYFNLSGDLKENILEHTLIMDSDKFCQLDQELIPTGIIEEAADGPFDFKEGKKIGRDIFQENINLKHAGGYDHPFILNHSKTAQVVLQEDNSGRVLEISTDQPVVVCYTSCQMENDLILSGERTSEKYLGVCLETQNYPDGVNNESFPKGIYNPGEKYRATTVYKFSTR